MPLGKETLSASKIPMLQRNGYAQSYELTAAVMGKNKSKRG